MLLFIVSVFYLVTKIGLVLAHLLTLPASAVNVTHFYIIRLLSISHHTDSLSVMITLK